MPIRIFIQNEQPQFSLSPTDAVRFRMLRFQLESSAKTLNFKASDPQKIWNLWVKWVKCQKGRKTQFANASKALERKALASWSSAYKLPANDCEDAVINHNRDHSQIEATECHPANGIEKPSTWMVQLSSREYAIAINCIYLKDPFQSKGNCHRLHKRYDKSNSPPLSGSCRLSFICHLQVKCDFPRWNYPVETFKLKVFLHGRTEWSWCSVAFEAFEANESRSNVATFLPPYCEWRSSIARALPVNLQLASSSLISSSSNISNSLQLWS